MPQVFISFRSAPQEKPPHPTAPPSLQLCEHEPKPEPPKSCKNRVCGRVLHQMQEEAAPLPPNTRGWAIAAAVGAPWTAPPGSSIAALPFPPPSPLPAEAPGKALSQLGHRSSLEHGHNVPKASSWGGSCCSPAWIQPRAVVPQAPASPLPAPQGSAIPAGRRDEEAPTESSHLCSSSPAKQSPRNQGQFNTGKCFEEGRLGEMSLSSSQESHPAARNPMALRASQFLSSREEARCGSQSQGCLLTVTSHPQGTNLQRLEELLSQRIHTTRELWKTTLSSGCPRFQGS